MDAAEPAAHKPNAGLPETNTTAKPLDPRNSLRAFLLLDIFVRVLIWSNSLILTTFAFNAVGAWPAGNPLSSHLGTVWHWGARLGHWVLLYNFVYVAHLVVLRLLIPTPREGRYPLRAGQGLDRQVIWSCFLGALTKARHAAPFPGFLVFHIANLPPMCWLMGPVFGPKTRSGFATDPHILDPHLVSIGRNVVLGLDATIAGHHVERDAIVYKRTVIEDDIVIGGDVKILSGVHIKSGAVIAPGSVLLPDTVVGENEYWWGVPARKFRQLAPLT